eukprot:CAMPEP_0178381750 /NCGR_PEP_ID=MMETSP0689_2-20121128/6147_1 /TAXON_ID=160604 /ORGANISM="Amphidinium massartii, Strain CS-259" /LENGTH=256 /DNA_ID=CAMNT_0020001949 /DNA_START=303 /DNA_END=1073 /DNA_ORIENTATION=-
MLTSAVWPAPLEADPAYQNWVEKIQHPKTCAVVSNSGVMLQHEHGGAIDASDIVFRFNDAEIGGSLQSAVGGREDVRIVNHASTEPMMATNSTPSSNVTIYLLNLYRPTEKVKQLISDSAAVAGDPMLHFAFGNQLVMARAAREILVREFGTSIPIRQRLRMDVLTSGFQGVMLALTLCDEVHAYGFAHTPGSSQSPFHYYGALKTGNASINVETKHEIIADREKQLYKMLALNADVDTSDVSVIPGFPSLQCEES